MITVYGANTTRDDLRKITPTTPPNAGRRWQPIPHGVLADTVADECLSRGWRILGEAYSTARDGADMAGAFTLRVPGVEVPAGMDLSIGFLNSNARRRGLRVVVGAQVRVCLNGMCSGEVLLSRVHDRTCNLVEEVATALDHYTTTAATLTLDVRSLRECEIAPATASEILLEAGRRKLIGWAAVGRVDAEYRDPTFSDHGRDNSWALLNAFTYAARQNINPVNQMTAYNEFRKMLPVANVQPA